MKVEVVVGRNVSDLHLECEPYSCIQIASQFNALEMISPEVSHRDGIVRYSNDRTQGPIGVLCCLPGLITRNYWYTNRYSSQPDSLKHLNLPTKNGYLLWGKDSSQALQILSSPGAMDKLITPIMAYTQVVGVRTDGYKASVHRTNKLVHQIFCSAAPGSYYDNSMDFHSEINEILLRQQYKNAIIYSLLLRQQGRRAKLHLTMVGGGAFQVSKDLIAQCIKDTLDEYKDQPIDVYLEIYSQEDSFLFQEYM